MGCHPEIMRAVCMCVFAWVCVCVWVRDRERGRETRTTCWCWALRLLPEQGQLLVLPHTAAEKVSMKSPEERQLWTDSVSPVHNTVETMKYTVCIMEDWRLVGIPDDDQGLIFGKTFKTCSKLTLIEKSWNADLNHCQRWDQTCCY